MADDPWMMRVESAMSAHFKQESGPSRPGVMWAIGLKRGNETYHTTVKGLLTDDATSETQRDKEYQGKTVMEYLNDQLQQGWNPRQQKEHTIYIGNPLAAVGPSSSKQASKKPWWKVW
jgi:hypothetical protein